MTSPTNESSVKQPQYSKETLEAMKEALHMLHDPNTVWYDSMEELKKALEED